MPPLLGWLPAHLLLNPSLVTLLHLHSVERHSLKIISHHSEGKSLHLPLSLMWFLFSFHFEFLGEVPSRRGVSVISWNIMKNKKKRKKPFLFLCWNRLLWYNKPVRKKLSTGLFIAVINAVDVMWRPSSLPCPSSQEICSESVNRQRATHHHNNFTRRCYHNTTHYWYCAAKSAICVTSALSPDAGSCCYPIDGCHRHRSCRWFVI